MTAPDPGNGFLWGAATSAHQIEGAVAEGGRGESIWDRFEKTPGRIADGTSASVACDHFHRWRDDIRLLEWLGVGAYRFSVAWPRVLPAGTGAVNEGGLDFYDVLVDELLEAGIRPFVTLYHWDLPQALQERGGWTARETASAFVTYARAVADRLGDRVKLWATHNEPWCIAQLGHETGEHAPGHTDPKEALAAAHHLLLSHGWAVPEIRTRAPGAEIGIVVNPQPVWPASEERRDLEAARRFDGRTNRWYLDPIFRGAYPEDILEALRAGGLGSGARLPFEERGDLGAMQVPIDYLGVNYYSRAVIRGDARGEPVGVPPGPSAPVTAMGWEVFPLGLYELLVRLHRDYAPAKLYVTENGAAYADRIDSEGNVRDPERLEYLRSHLDMTARAISAGVPVAGYFVWSLLDNFEWAQGYTKRFGLFYTEYETQRRIPKESAHWYRDLLAAGRGARPPLLATGREA